LEPEQCRFLSDLRSKRNDAAHPNGHVVTKEHAHYLLSDAITFFLKNRTVYPKQAVADLKSKLRGGAFLPVNGSTDHHKLAVAEEMKLFSAKTYGALFSMLVELLSGEDAVARSSSRLFVETLAKLHDESLRGHLVSGLFAKRVSSLGDFDDEYSKALFWAFVWDPQIGDHFTPAQLLEFDQSLASYCKDSLRSEDEWMAPEYLFENLLAATPDLLGQKLPRTTGFLAANYPASKNALSLLLMSPLTRDFVLIGFEEVINSKNKDDIRRLMVFIAKNESQFTKVEMAETALRLLRAVYGRPFAPKNPHKLNALMSFVEGHYGATLEEIPRDVGERCHVPYVWRRQLSLDRFVKPSVSQEVDPAREYEWDWSR
jgi:hypothetical protein